MNEADRTRRSSIPVWLLLLVVAATAIYFVTRDLGDRAKANRTGWERLGDDIRKARAEEEVRRLLGPPPR